MNAQTHTPGPWLIINSGKLPIHVGAIDARWKHVPGTLLAEVGGNLSVGTGNFEEDLANANLIAAAPDLLTAAKMALDCAQSLNSEMTAAYAALHTAVAKAEGQP